MRVTKQTNPNSFQRVCYDDITFYEYLLSACEALMTSMCAYKVHCEMRACRPSI